MNFGLCHAALAPAAYASRIVLPPSLQGSLPAGWLSLYREGVEPSGSLQKVSDHPSSFSGLSLAQGKFHVSPSGRAIRCGRLSGSSVLLFPKVVEGQCRLLALSGHPEMSTEDSVRDVYLL